MFCPRCGAQNPENSQFCGVCGATIEAVPVATVPVASDVTVGGGLSIAAIVSFGAAALAALLLLLPCVSISLPLQMGVAESSLASAAALPIPAVSSLVATLINYVNLFLSMGMSQMPQLQSISGSLGVAGFFNMLVYPLWVITIVSVGVAGYATFSSKGSVKIPLIVAGGLCFITALLWVVFVGFVNGAFQDFLTLMVMSGSSTSSWVGAGVAATWNIWGAIFLGFVSLVSGVLGKLGVLR